MIARAAGLLRYPGAPTWHLVLAAWLDSLARDAASARTENGILRLGLCDDPPCIRYAMDLADACLREHACGALDAADRQRSADAGQRDVTRLADALAVTGSSCPPRWREVAEARIAGPGRSWAEIAAGLGISKDAAFGCCRRLLALAAAKAGAS